jgi:hypothetical protein
MEFADASETNRRFEVLRLTMVGWRSAVPSMAE